MKNIFCLLAFFLGLIQIIGQENSLPGFIKTKIESGSTFKKYENGKLDSIIVSMVAMNYGNAILFSRTNDAIIVKNAADDKSLIKIELKNKMQVKTFFYQNEPIITIESIDFDRHNLPKNTAVSTSVENNLVSTYSVNSKLESFTGEIDDKSLKLFYGLNIPSNLNNLEAIFENFGDFFSEEDALLKIFYGSYAEKFVPKFLAYLQTDGFGKIKKGILWDFAGQKLNQKNKFEIFSSGKIIKSGNLTADDFQTIFREYLEKNWDDQ